MIFNCWEGYSCGFSQTEDPSISWIMFLCLMVRRRSKARVICGLFHVMSLINVLLFSSILLSRGVQIHFGSRISTWTMLTLKVLSWNPYSLLVASGWMTCMLRNKLKSLKRFLKFYNREFFGNEYLKIKKYLDLLGR